MFEVRNIQNHYTIEGLKNPILALVIIFLFSIFITPVHSSLFPGNFSCSCSNLSKPIWQSNNSSLENSILPTNSILFQFDLANLKFSSVFERLSNPHDIIKIIGKTFEFSLTNTVVNNYPTLSGNYNSNNNAALNDLITYIMNIYYYILSIWAHELYSQIQSSASTELNNISTQVQSSASTELNGISTQVQSFISTNLNSVYSQFLSFFTPKSSITEQTMGSLSVISVPPGATIYLDGTQTPYTTPATLPSISAGSHIVKLTLSGYEDYSFTFITGSGGSYSITLVPSDLIGIQNKITLTGLNILSSTTSNDYPVGGNFDYKYFSIQQNFYVNYPPGDLPYLGGPGYWIQNVLIVREDSQGNFAVSPTFNAWNQPQEDNPKPTKPLIVASFTPIQLGDSLLITSTVQNNQVEMKTSLYNTQNNNFQTLSDNNFGWPLPSGSCIYYGVNIDENPELVILGPPSYLNGNTWVIGNTIFGVGTNGQIQSQIMLSGNDWTLPSITSGASGQAKETSDNLNIIPNSGVIEFQLNTIEVSTNGISFSPPFPPSS